jgi:ABC-2 type transport system permease protein
VPLALLDGWLKIAATINPITYVLEAMRQILNQGWDSTVIMKGVLACLVMAAVMYALAAFALRVRTRRN